MEGGVSFRVWAPKRRDVEVVLERGAETGGRKERGIRLEPDGDGYFTGFVNGLAEGALYRFRLDRGERLFSDPASRFQPQGPQGPSQVVDPARYQWTDKSWEGVQIEGQVVYEMHIGTFTPLGTWDSAAKDLKALRDVGITMVEIMPVADFDGGFGWGYDGVNMFAPTRLYGTPDDFRRFVDRAHAEGLAVILDVVYNHLGPSGNYLPEFSPYYFTKKHANEWGQAINFDGEHTRPVRDFFITNAACWIAEYHLDGLRFDATQTIFDDSPVHVLEEIGVASRKAAGNRSVVLVAENESQETVVARPIDGGGYGLDALWNDDFHHSVLVRLSGRREAYYSDYVGSPSELIAAVKWGYLFQGQRFAWQKKRRGTPALDVKPASFVAYLENHDQVANSAHGHRIHQIADHASCRAVTALLLLAPSTPLLFQGQEFWASSPFLYFADHEPELARAVRNGRREFLSQFPSIAALGGRLDAPDDVRTFERCKLDPAERERHTASLALHRDLLRLRREDPAFSAQRTGGVDGAVLGPAAFVLRFFGGGRPGVGEYEALGDRLLVVNLDVDLPLASVAEPLLAPPAGMQWDVVWSSEDPRYGGAGTPPVETDGGWRLPGRTAVVLAPAPTRDQS